VGITLYKLVNKDAHLKNLFRGLAHELRGSMGACASFAQLIKQQHENAFDETALRTLDLMTTEYESTKQLLVELSSYADLFDCKVDLLECSITDIASRALNACNEFLSSDGGVVDSGRVNSMMLETEGLSSLKTSPDLMFQFIYEVLLNSAQHAVPSKNKGLKCKMSCLSHANGFRLILSDNGSLLKERDLDYILKPFKTLKSSRSNTLSAGLGMSKLIQIADLLSAELRFDFGKDDFSGLQVELDIPAATTSSL
jgi:light-regulated signal transduction histidine kinase (bacteriophytochrome)